VRGIIYCLYYLLLSEDCLKKGSIKMNSSLELSLVIPALHEGPNLAILLPRLKEILETLILPAHYEILVVTAGTDQETLEAAKKSEAQVIEQSERGYGGALKAGFDLAQGHYIITMDADLSHPPVFIKDLWEQREAAGVVIASRYVPGGKASMPFGRYLLSRILNSFFARGLDLPVKDLSSGYRLYQAGLLKNLELTAHDFNVLIEILVRLYSEGKPIKEVPFKYAPRIFGSSNARIFAFGVEYIKTFYRLRVLRRKIRAGFSSASHE
jgi:dolichol-phosphate mannosyltransferase